MSKKIRGFHRLAAPALLVGLVIPLTGGCSSDALDPTSCAANLEAKVDALQGAADALVQVAGEMKVSVGVACKGIAMAGGEDPGADITAESSDEDLQAVCGKAEAAITANLSAAGSVSLTIEGGKCEVAAEAQLNCEANCSVEGECTPGSIEARCDPGELSVSCEGECAGGATCEGSAEVAANCDGECSGNCVVEVTGGCEGTCEGSCDGTCSAMDGQGNCAGTCEGTCTGTCSAPSGTARCTGQCTGECKLAADAKIECGAEVKCKGTCNGTATAPSCEANLEPPECNLDADCQAGCEGQASLKAECTPPKVTFNFSGNVDANFVAALEANLPALLNVVAKGELAVKAAGDVAVKFGEVVVEVGKAAGCVAKFGASLAAKAEASVKASASVSVSVNASASASGKASSGG
ncbi:MAG: hypothetical protein H6718_02135 [Polyangiaceae bacterium]|nr:hypothetical protein [Polyangiaceae bacterium]